MKPQSLRIDMADWDGVRRYAEYANFGMKGEDENYELSIADYTGDAGECTTHMYYVCLDVEVCSWA